MKITWVTRSFLDYRIPIYQEINRLTGNQLTVIYYADVVPDRCEQKLEAVLEDRAVGLSGEYRLLGKKHQPLSSVTKGGIRVPIQPGLIKAVLSTKPDVILSDGFFQWTYAALICNAIYRIPHVMCYEGTIHTERNVGRIRTLYRKLVSRFISRIACNGMLCEDYIKSIGYPSSQISIGNMTADTEGLSLAIKKSNQSKSAIKDQLNIPGKIMLFVGRLVELKGLRQLVSVWGNSLKNEPDLSLVIVGDGPINADLQNLVKKDSSENIVFTGAIDYDEIHQYFSAADLFILPTLQDNWSLVIPEAMACGLPVATSKYNGCWPELVKPENGWVFDPLDQENFIATLREVWERRAEWPEMGEASKKIIRTHTPEKVARKIYSACEKAKNG